MNISALTAYRPAMRSQLNTTPVNQPQANQQPAVPAEKSANNDVIKKYPAAVVGIVNGLCWSSVGFAFDKICSKIFKYESSNKVSLAINSIIGAGMGIYAYVQAKKMQKADTTANV